MVISLPHCSAAPLVRCCLAAVPRGRPALRSISPRIPVERSVGFCASEPCATRGSNAFIKRPQISKWRSALQTSRNPLIPCWLHEIGFVSFFSLAGRARCQSLEFSSLPLENSELVKCLRWAMNDPSAATYDAVVVVSFGGPDKREDVIPFLENVLRGRNVPRERMTSSRLTGTTMTKQT